MVFWSVRLGHREGLFQNTAQNGMERDHGGIWILCIEDGSHRSAGFSRRLRWEGITVRPAYCAFFLHDWERMNAFPRMK